MEYYKDFNIEGNSNFALPLIIDASSRHRENIMNDVCKILENRMVEYRVGTAGGGNQARQPYLKKYDFEIVGSLINSNYIHEYGLYVGNHTDLTEEQIIDLCKRLNDV